MNKNEGILYFSNGNSYYAETIRSARFAKKFMSSIPLALYTDARPCDSDLELFDSIEIIKMPHFSFLDKILPLKKRHFTKLYL